MCCLVILLMIFFCNLVSSPDCSCTAQLPDPAKDKHQCRTQPLQPKHILLNQAIQWYTNQPQQCWLPHHACFCTIQRPWLCQEGFGCRVVVRYRDNFAHLLFVKDVLMRYVPEWRQFYSSQAVEVSPRLNAVNLSSPGCGGSGSDTSDSLAIGLFIHPKMLQMV